MTDAMSGAGNRQTHGGPNAHLACHLAASADLFQALAHIPEPVAAFELLVGIETTAIVLNKERQIVSPRLNRDSDFRCP
jgi:hypothetical protein